MKLVFHLSSWDSQGVQMEYRVLAEENSEFRTPDSLLGNINKLILLKILCFDKSPRHHAITNSKLNNTVEGET